MKKLISLILAVILICSTAAAMADKIAIDGLTKRNIKINKAGLNPSADEMFEQGISPTTGRKLSEIEVPDGFAGFAATGRYFPAIVQISHNDVAVKADSKGRPVLAPVNGSYADVVYESYNGNNSIRHSFVYSDVIPDYVGWVRSTRMTHARIRQEWDCAFCTSGYSDIGDVKGEWAKYGVPAPDGKRTEEDPGLVYVGDMSKPWSKYVWRFMDKYNISALSTSSNNELFQLADLMTYLAPKDHVAANHTWKFSEELPEGGDKADIIYVNWGANKSDSFLEYDEDDKCYYRYETDPDTKEPKVYKEQRLINPTEGANNDGQRRIIVENRELGEPITFSNVIVQSVNQKFRNGDSDRPEAEMTGEGCADYFMGGKHYAGVWQREDINDRTVYYGEDGNEISLQPGRTLIILMAFNREGKTVEYQEAAE